MTSMSFLRTLAATSVAKPQEANSSVLKNDNFFLPASQSHAV